VLKGSITACAVSVLYAFGCSPAPGQVYDVVIDPAFSVPERVYALDALNSWEAILDGRLRVPSVSTGPCSGASYQICIHAASLAQIVALGGDADALGRTLRSDVSDRADVYIISYPDPSGDVTRTIAHELGHAMGLEHTQGGTLMCCDTRCAAPLPTCDDVDQWDVVRHGFIAEKSCPRAGTLVYTGN
jgi:hypothetical protein